MQLCPKPTCETNNQDHDTHCNNCREPLRRLRGAGELLAGRYRIAKLLGCGGFGAVYLAEDEQLYGARVALKECLALQYRDAFEQEARLLARLLRHPNLPQVRHRFEAGGHPFLVMDYVAGEESTARAPLSEAEALRLFGELLAAVEHLHAEDPPIIHRDIKPGNVRITPLGHPILVDFGIAKAMDGTSQLSVAAHTSGFAPPEQVARQGTDERSDIYSLGATLYYWLAKVAPPRAEARADYARDGHPDLPSVRIKNPAVSKATDALLDRCLRLKPSARFQSVKELQAALEAVLQSANAFPVAASPAVSPSPQGSRPVPLASRKPVSPTHNQPIRARSSRRLLKGVDWEYWVIQAGIGVALIALLATVGVVSYRAFTEWSTQRAAQSGHKPVARGAGQTRTNLKDGATMVWVPAGEFSMGNATGESDERPVHRVRISKGFWLSQTEVTVAQYRKFCEQTGRQMPPTPRWGWKDDHPIVNMTWQDATAYCRWAGGRLPTEAEWEWSARGPASNIYPWGDKGPLANSVHYGQNSEAGSTSPVLAYPGDKSWCGAVGLAGNVEEWCSDWYAPKYYAISPSVDPVGPAGGKQKALRGGTWTWKVSGLRAANRNGDEITRRYNNVGFRLVVAE